MLQLNLSSVYIERVEVPVYLPYQWLSFDLHVNVPPKSL